MSRIPSKWTEEQKLQMVEMYRKGVPTPRIAAEFGTTRNSVNSILRTRIKLDRRKRLTKLKYPVPEWVPKKLHAEYVRIFREQGETAAAKWARQEKSA